jgi:hemin uptake protein HemP
MTTDQHSSQEESLIDMAMPSDPAPIISSQELLQGRREIFIDHEGHLYRLRLTSRGKLYLTK